MSTKLNLLVKVNNCDELEKEGEYSFELKVVSINFCYICVVTPYFQNWGNIS